MEMLDTCVGKTIPRLYVLCMGNCSKEQGTGSSRRREVFLAGAWGDGKHEEEESQFKWLRSGSMAAFRKMLVLKIPVHPLFHALGLGKS